MLAVLSIRNIVLIERLDLEFSPGLTVLTGETGAGKSILLDSFGLALGARGDAGLVRQGAKKGQVTALFHPPENHQVFKLLTENGLDGDAQLVLRRQQNADGRTRSFVNDVPVSLALLRRLGQCLVEIHGQHDDRALLDASAHRSLLDAFGGLEAQLRKTAAGFEAMKEARRKLRDHQAGMERIRERAGYLSHVLEELRMLDPQPDEEEELAGRRQVMMSAEKIARELGGAEKALSEKGALKGLAAILRKLERQPAGTRDLLDPVTAALEKILLEVGEARIIVQEALSKCRFAPNELDETEQRLFALRDAARKYRVPVVELPQLFARVERELAALDEDEARLQILHQRLEESEKYYEKQAQILGKKRQRAARDLDSAVKKELAPLKLERADFITRISTDRQKPGPAGYDQVVFHVRTNPGARSGPLLQVASGGELSRFILALKVVLASRGAAPVLIFDEIDKGVGGATAAAIGERLSRLGQDLQVFAVTHAPQIAALAKRHMLISKTTRNRNDGEETTTMVSILDKSQRREEIARMLAGNRVTNEARAAARRLMGSKT